MADQRITAGTFTAVVSRPDSGRGGPGCLVVCYGADMAAVEPCLFLTETTARQLTDVLVEACARFSQPVTQQTSGILIEQTEKTKA